MENNHVVDNRKVVLEVDNLKKHFTSGTGKNKLVVPAVDGVSFNVYEQEVFGVVGESGCGKTTTGRTVMKLYSATEGTVKLNGDIISAGHKGIERQIVEVKEEAKRKLVEIDKHAEAVHKIEEKLEHDLIDAEHNLNKVLEANKEVLKDLRKPLDDHRDETYRIKNKYELEVAKVEHKYKLAVEKIKGTTKNVVEDEYNKEVARHKLGLSRKTVGLKESAALEKSVIEKRMADLNAKYDQIFKKLEERYKPLIAEAEGQIVSKSDAKAQIKVLTNDKKTQVSALKDQYKKDKTKLAKPDSSAIKAKINEEKARQKAEVSKLKKNISELKSKAKEATSKVPDNKALGVDISALEAEKKAIQKWEQEEVSKLKEKIAYYKDVNKSKEALETSRKMQMIFQDPISSLNPRLTVEEIVGEGLVIKGGHSQEEIKEKVAVMLEKVGLQASFAARYPHEFSGGQRQRIGIARALIMEPDFVIADEPISALDVSIRAQVLNLLHGLKDELGLTIMFIAHDLSVVRFFCDRIAVMYYGKIVEMAEAEELFNNPMHPYTKSLLSAVPQPDPDYEKNRIKIGYNPATAHDYRHDKPSLREIVPGHSVYVNDAEFEKIKNEYFDTNERPGDVQ
ncbi:ABC transporter ATP-binding protein [Acidaminobacter sp. JC074]|uniref:oligopeptide/dipeptide ABC transporter ATP-binding protein n=1 Tax=Acidaminobacter sp. JC074 TaxID=2530199 RepID=UPI00216F1237|nr:ABC transporter ATP-binding protein [Acidaminobacter sp. JC074]